MAAIRVLVITPTRELATQIHNVLEKLAKYTDVTFALICGGKKDIKSQEVRQKKIHIFRLTHFYRHIIYAYAYAYACVNR